LLEYLYCPRFTYFEHVLQISERQEKRFKVQKGRDVHEERKHVNPGYLRKKLGVTQRELDMELNAVHLHLRGKVDEILTLDDGTMAPFDYKYAEHKGRIFRNLKIQVALYAILIEEVYQTPVNRGYLCYTRSDHKLVEVPVDSALKAEALDELHNCAEVIRGGVYPTATDWPARCPDCCYRNLCIK
jgi:CRISPR-associated exonuclease Cas4